MAPRVLQVRRATTDAAEIADRLKTDNTAQSQAIEKYRNALSSIYQALPSSTEGRDSPDAMLSDLQDPMHLVNAIFDGIKCLRDGREGQAIEDLRKQLRDAQFDRRKIMADALDDRTKRNEEFKRETEEFQQLYNENQRLKQERNFWNSGTFEGGLGEIVQKYRQSIMECAEYKRNIRELEIRSAENAIEHAERLFRVRELEQRCLDLESNPQDIDVKETARNQHDEDMKNASQQLGAAAAKIQELNSCNEQLQNNLLAKENELQASADKISAIQATCDQLESDAQQKLFELKSQSSRNEQLQAQVDEATKARDAAQVLLQTTETARGEAEADRDRYKKEKEDQHTELEQVYEQLAGCQTELADAKQQIETLGGENTKLQARCSKYEGADREMGARFKQHCSLVETAISDERHKLKSKEQRIQELEKDLENKKTEYEMVFSRLSQVEEELQQRKAIDDCEHDDVQTIKQKLRDERKRSNDERAEAWKTKSKLETEKSNLEMEKSDLAEQLTQLNAQLGEESRLLEEAKTSADTWMYSCISEQDLNRKSQEDCRKLAALKRGIAMHGRDFLKQLAALRSDSNELRAKQSEQMQQFSQAIKLVMHRLTQFEVIIDSVRQAQCQRCLQTEVLFVLERTVDAAVSLTDGNRAPSAADIERMQLEFLSVLSSELREMKQDMHDLQDAVAPFRAQNQSKLWQEFASTIQGPFLSVSNQNIFLSKQLQAQIQNYNALRNAVTKQLSSRPAVKRSTK